LKILSVSDVEVGFLYSSGVRERFADVDVVISCGDLSYYYLEYITSMLDAPLFYVLGNHHNQVEEGAGGPRSEPWGGCDLHRRVVNHCGLLLAGIEGSVRYNNGPHQYTQSEMWSLVWSLAPGLMLNRLRYGRYLDIFVSHAPPRGIQDSDDHPHHGIQAFRWLLGTFKPAVHLHGHTHIYRADTVTETIYRKTRVINSFGYRQMQFTPGKCHEVVTEKSLLPR